MSVYAIIGKVLVSLLAIAIVSLISLIMGDEWTDNETWWGKILGGLLLWGLISYFLIFFIGMALAPWITFGG